MVNLSGTVFCGAGHNGIIFIMCIIMGIQSAKAADRKQDIKQKIIDYEKDIADRNRVISKQRQEIDFLTLKLKELQERSKK